MTSWTEHGDGVFTIHYDALSQNIGAVVAGEGIVVIDTRSHLGQARELRSDLRRISRMPVRWVISTHHHWDHTFGNAVFRPAEFWGHVRCAEVLLANGEAMRQSVMAAAPDHADAFAEVVIIPPDHTFHDQETARFGDREVTMEYHGRGHTDNDIVVRVGQVTFAGDLVEQGSPPAFGDAYPLEWGPTLVGALAGVDGLVVPGHGTVVDHAFVADQAAEIEEIGRLARDRHAAGMSIDQAALAGGPYPQATMRDAFERAWLQLDHDG